MCAITHPGALPLLKATVLFKYKISVRKREVRYLPLDLADPAEKKKGIEAVRKCSLLTQNLPVHPYAVPNVPVQGLGTVLEIPQLRTTW